jgi:predicted NACHT family NTPase
VVEVMKLRAGLLLERVPEVYTFPHRTFQEYLAGAPLSIQADFAQQGSRLAAERAFWHQLVLLAVGRLVYLNGETVKLLALVEEM